MKGRRRILLAGLALLACVAALYGQVVHHEFLTLDDPTYFVDNPAVTSGLSVGSVRWAFTSLETGNWHPLTWLSYMAGVDLAGVKPGPHLAMNALLHGANAVLVLLVLTAYTGTFWRPALVALLFAVHPLHVESVAWLSERKDVLSAFFFLLSLLAYRRYAARPRISRLWATGLLLALGLMAKPMLVTTPFVLLLLDLWPLNRLAVVPAAAAGQRPAFVRGLLRLLIEKTPLILLAAAFGAAAYAAQRAGGALLLMEHFSLAERLGNAMLSYGRYLGKTVFPLSLSVFYPLRRVDVTLPAAAAAAVLLAAATAAVFALLRRRPYLAAGWLWFVGMLVPVIGLVQVGGQAMADRYTYLPLLGLFVAGAWGAAELVSPRRVHRASAVLLACAVAGLLTSLAWRQIGLWRDSGTLFAQALQAQPRTSFALVHLALHRERQGSPQEALALYEEALRINPDDAVANNNYATLQIRRGREDVAVVHLRRALGRDPDNVEALTNLGVALAARGAADEARSAFRRALALDPRSYEAAYDLGVLASRQGRWEEAEASYRTALAIEPRRTETLNMLGIALASQGRVGEAMDRFRESLRIDPGNRNARENLEALQAGTGPPGGVPAR
jgi:Tfp pilus assembly protein PilF